MKKSVLVALASHNYFLQAKQLFSAAYWRAGWKGDYLLLAHEIPEEDLAWFTDKGIHVRRCSPLLSGKGMSSGYTVTGSKLYMFCEEFKKWKSVVYLDTDVVIRAPFDELGEVKGFAACRSTRQTLSNNIKDLRQLDEGIRKELLENYDLNKGAFNTGVMAFNTDIIDQNTFQSMKELFAKCYPVALFADQLPLNLFFYDRWERLPAVYNLILSLDEASDTKPEDVRGIIIHTVKFGDGPWNPKSIFHTEWRENLGMAETIDLERIPSPPRWSRTDIQKYSKEAIGKELVGFDTLTLKSLLRLLSRVFAAFANDFRAACRKSSETIRDLFGLGC